MTPKHATPLHTFRPYVTHCGCIVRRSVYRNAAGHFTESVELSCPNPKPTQPQGPHR